MKPDPSKLLEFLYGPADAPALLQRFENLTETYRAQIPEKLRQADAAGLTERDVILITYADQIRAPGEAPLQTLAKFLEETASDLVSAVHILPFYPSSSDDGFAVKDYFAVDPEFGEWKDVARLSERFDLMADAVFNHMSAQSGWFRQFLNDDPAFAGFFVTVEGDPDLSAVVRPRALPLITEFESASGPRKVWTTFSADQVDVDVRNPEVLFALLEALLFYASNGARFIRLDAIAYLWKQIGTTCIHLPQTHAVIQLMRAALNVAAPRVLLITETNVPHSDNISYFGNGVNEAQMVYNFALPPLVVHSFQTGNATALSRWAAGLSTPSEETTFLNFLASHDGIGVNPARGILSPEEIDALVSATLARRGFISEKNNPDGSRSPYEMNINFLDALAEPGAPDSDPSLAQRLLTAYAIAAALPGTPGIYIHSLLGSRGDRAAAETSGIPRRINRAKLDLATLRSELADPRSLRRRVLDGFRALLSVRRAHSAFRPAAGFRILDMDPRLFVVARADQGDGEILCLHNVSGETVETAEPRGESETLLALNAERVDGRTRLMPCGALWLRRSN
jgi:glycosidase